MPKMRKIEMCNTRKYCTYLDKDQTIRICSNANDEDGCFQVRVAESMALWEQDMWKGSCEGMF
jgi:hypothetical protein